MARTIDSAVQTLLESEHGQQIVVVLEVFWSDQQDVSIQGPSERIWYADRPIPSAPYVKSSILSLSPVDATVQISQGGQTKSINVTLDDTDGDVKEIFDVRDIHKTPVRVWFFVEGTDFETKKFPIFLGQINTPVTWDEGERTFTFSVVNRIEDVEVGFSAEEGEFSELPEELIGKTFPLCFGTVTNVPALKAVPSISGVLANGVGIADFTLGNRIQLAEKITCPRTPIGFKCSGGQSLGGTTKCVLAFEDDQNCLQSRCHELEILKLQLEEQQSFQFKILTIFGGEKFPQGWAVGTPTTGGGGDPIRTASGSGKIKINTLTLNINGGLFTGFFDGTPETPSDQFIIQTRRHPLYDPSTGGVKKDPVQEKLESKCPGADFENEDSDVIDTIFGPIWTGMRTSRISWENYRAAETANFFWAAGGSTVTLENNREIVYIANLIPSTIHSVKAKRFVNGNELLLTVPDEFYEIRQTDYTGYDVMEIVFQRPLSTESQGSGGGWSDDIYVTQTSSVGPNTVDILKWFIETYTSFDIDSTSFDDVRTKIDNYPMHFPLLRRPGLLSILQELSRKARCALWQRDDTFFIKYLAEEPTAVATITESDILQDSPDGGKSLFKMELSPTEDLITKHTSEWRKDYGPFTTELNKLILRHNVKKYGTHDAVEDYFPYVHLDLVRKSATFWLIRTANTWKRLRLSTSLEFSLLEPFDAVTIQLADLARDAAGDPVNVLGVVERAVLDSAGKQIDLEIWTPVRAGELLPYDFAFPAFIAEAALFPTIEDRSAGRAGSGAQPNFSTIAPPGHPLNPDRSGVFSGFSLGCNGDGVTSLKPGECRGDFGDRKPSDIGDQKPNVPVGDDSTADVSGSTAPVMNGAGNQTGSRDWLCCKERQEKIEGDAGRGREYGWQNPPDQEVEVPLNDEFLDNLPDPDDLTGCRYEVEVAGFPTESSFGGVPTREFCVPTGPEYTEIYVWDSQEAAEQFCGNLSSQHGDCGNPPCGVCIERCLVTQKGDCTGGDGDGDLIGYRPGPDGSGEAFINK